MPVYVDDMRAPLGRMTMCHMVADTSKELYEMGVRINLRRQWVQDIGTAREHYDISLGKRELALKYGAVEITRRELLGKMKEKGETNGRESTEASNQRVHQR